MLREMCPEAVTVIQERRQKIREEERRTKVECSTVHCTVQHRVAKWSTVCVGLALFAPGAASP